MHVHLDMYLKCAFTCIFIVHCASSCVLNSAMSACTLVSNSNCTDCEAYNVNQSQELSSAC